MHLMDGDFDAVAARDILPIWRDRCVQFVPAVPVCCRRHQQNHSENSDDDVVHGHLLMNRSGAREMFSPYVPPQPARTLLKTARALSSRIGPKTVSKPAFDDATVNTVPPNGCVGGGIHGPPLLPVPIGFPLIS